MKRTKTTIFIILILAFSAVPLALFTFSAAEPTIVLPEYNPVDWKSGLAGDVLMPEIDFEDMPSGAVASSAGLPQTSGEVGDNEYDWYLSAIGNAVPTMTLKAQREFVEVWVADDLLYPEGDPRNDNLIDVIPIDAMYEYLADEFNDVIYQTVTDYFGTTEDRDGTGTIFEAMGWPAYTYAHIETDEPQKVILKVLNIRDDSYYNPEYPAYVVGFFSPTYTINYYNRNMIHIDNWKWWQRLGPEGYQWYPDEHPELEVTRPELYESVTAHEYQHNVHGDQYPEDDLFMNEASSLFAEPLCGYELDAGQIEWFLATPDNSLTKWGDQGDINILADYGAALLFALYLTDHYGIDFMGRYTQANTLGYPTDPIARINALLVESGYDADFYSVFRDWKLANFIQADEGIYGYQLDELLAINPDAILDFDELEPLKIQEAKPKKKWTSAVEEFGETFTIGTTSTPDGYATGMFNVGPFGTEYIHFKNMKKSNLIRFDGDDIAVYGWTYDDYWGEWWSGAHDLYDALLVTNPYTVQADDILSVPSWWSIEGYWDYGFVQFSTDGGETWTSMSNDNTTTAHDPGAHPDIVANLPGFTGEYGGYYTLEFDLDEFITPGTEVIFGFRYMTDWATLEAGWYIVEAYVGETNLDLIPIYPETEFQVTIVKKFEWRNHVFYQIDDMWMVDDETEYYLKWVYAFKCSDVYLVVSPIQDEGYVDYEFSVLKLWGNRWHL